VKKIKKIIIGFTGSVLFILLGFLLFKKVQKPAETPRLNNEQKVTENPCKNYEDYQIFDEPIPIEWTARFDGCLAGCWGASFSRDPIDEKFPRFSGYVPDEGKPIAEKYRQQDQILKITGLWTDVTDGYSSVFDNMCTPTVEIEKIEIFE